MATENSRIIVSFEKETIKFLSSLAKYEHKSLPSIVKELALESLERREYEQLSKLALELDNPNGKIHSHFDAWK